MASTYVDADLGQTVPAASATPGDQLVVKVGGAWPAAYFIKLVSDGTRWVGPEVTMPVGSVDGWFVTGQQTDWSYIGNQTNPPAGWWLRASGVMYAGQLYAAGLRLQDTISARISCTVVAQIAALYYEYDDRDAVIFDNDSSSPGGTWDGHATQPFPPSSGNIGLGAVVKSDGSGTAKEFSVGYYADKGGYVGLTRNAGWDDVKFFASTVTSGTVRGGVPTTTATTPSKKYLYPTLYAKVASAATFSAAALGYRLRWVG